MSNHTEIAIHDSGQRLASFMYYVGGGTNQFYIGRDMGWGTIAQTNFYGNVSIGNSLFFKTDVWNYSSSDNQKRFIFKIIIQLILALVGLHWLMYLEILLIMLILLKLILTVQLEQ
jgi:hypothetical protein